MRIRTAKIRTSHAFTLIEIMIVVAIIAIVMTAGIPTMWRAISRDDQARAVHDLIEGAKSARDHAIITGKPYDLVIIADTRTINVEPSTKPGAATAASLVSTDKGSGSTITDFPRSLGQEVKLTDLFVNNVEFESNDEDPDLRVRFFPNGTCDEFMVVLKKPNDTGERFLGTDLVTGRLEEGVIKK